ncbi:MAG: 4-diphosphocytidyl-2C-methyl-D-erythritol kinase [Planctomycetes bacterium]|nr:4-diphosphocytidyl-2C-methyl-D-erythritol kinase [Planctomycetota bacterium]
MVVWSVVLAAGEGRRMGGNKGLVLLRGEPLVTHVLGTIAASRVDGAVVVIGAEADALRPIAIAQGATVVENPNWPDGQTSSLRCGIAALPAETDAFLVHPVDHALVTPEDLNALVDAFHRSPDPEFIARPVCGDVFGHPVLFGGSYKNAFLALPQDAPGHTVYREHRDRVSLVSVNNPNVGIDLDTPDDLAPFAD